jgi:hypothetical protein
MSFEFEEIKSLFEGYKSKPVQIKNDNIFGIGTRGYYENPFTEVLTYILNSENQFLYRKDFVNLFLSNIPDLSPEVVQSFLSDIKIITQHATTNRNYIDMILFNEKYILVFENKIYHWLANPLDDYENDIKLRYAHLAPYFYVFSYNKITTPGKWKNLIIGDMFMHIQKNIKFEFKNKWDFFVNDFLNHYSEKNNESMKKEEYEFYSENFAKIFAANNFANDFIRETVNKIKYSLSADAIIKNSAIIDWGDNLSKAVRFYPFNTMDNVVFIFRNDGKFSIAVYYYKEYLNHFNDLSLVVGKSDYRNWPEVSNSIVCFARLDNKEFIVIEDAISECAYQIDEMQKYYSNPN